MKAVDAVTLQVTELTGSPEGNVFLPGAGDGEQLKQRLTNGTSSTPATSPRKSFNCCNGTSTQNGFNAESPRKTYQNGTIENGESPVKTFNGTVESEKDHVKMYNGTANGVLNGVDKMNGFKDERIGVGVDNDGFDDECNEKHSLESLTLTDEEERGKRSRSPPEDIPRYQPLQVDSGLESAASSWDLTASEAREHAVARLTRELTLARQELRLKDEEVGRLSRIRQEMEAELEELTASLFQEAHNMVRVANERQAAAEKALRESNMQVEVLTAEVAALKTLVLTSTPARPNPHLHPQIETGTNTQGNALFRKHRRSPSHFNLKYGRENSPPDSPVKEPLPPPPTEPVDSKDGLEVDPVTQREFLAWCQSPSLDQTQGFLARVFCEDIDSCLAFTNASLAAEVRLAVLAGSVFIEAVNDKSKTHFPKRCALLEAPRQCQYRLRLGDTDGWHCISHLCRNRIIAVCDFLNYLKYIQRGLVKSSVHDMYWEMIRLRKDMVLARLGLPLSP